MTFTTNHVGRRVEDPHLIEARLKLHQEAFQGAHREFERVAVELAGPDETLRRVLLARLIDAHRQGYDFAREEDLFQFDYWSSDEGRKVMEGWTS